MAIIANKVGEQKVEVGKLKGTITIEVYEGKPVMATFVGDLKGHDISLAIRGLMRGYRLWKMNLAKKGEQNARR